jgi:hypothetical protein
MNEVAKVISDINKKLSTQQKELSPIALIHKKLHAEKKNISTKNHENL